MAAKTKRISADEARNHRKDHVKDTPKGTAVMKAGNLVSEVRAGRSYDPEARSARFIMTSQGGDRYGDIVMTEGGDTAEFERNPVALLFHNNRQWPVGTWGNLEKILKGRPPRLEGDLLLLPAGGPVQEVEQAAWMLEHGGLRACSIGFVPDWNEVEAVLNDEGHWTGLQFNKWELIECSICPVPANPDALMKMADGNAKIAVELVENILDNWTRSAAGVLMPRSEVEKLRDVTTKQRTHIVVKSGLPLRAPAALTKGTLQAASDDEAREFIGAKVVLNPSNKENEDCEHCKAIGTAEGEIVDSYIVPDGEKNGVHALCVEFLSDNWNGMFRGFAAERVMLASKPAPKEKAAEQLDLPVDDTAADQLRAVEFELAKICPAIEGMCIAVEGEVKGFVTVKGGKMAHATGDEPKSVNMVVTTKQVGDKVIYEISKAYAPSLIKSDKGEWEAKDLQRPEGKEQPATIVVNLDTTEVEDGITRLGGLLDGLKEKLSGVFGRSKTAEERVEPTLDSPPVVPTAAEIEAARSSAAEALQRVSKHLN